MIESRDAAPVRDQVALGALSRVFLQVSLCGFGGGLALAAIVPPYESDVSVLFKSSATISTKRIAVESAASTFSGVTTDPGPVS